MIKVVLDTNVLVSAIVFGGKPRIILEKVIEGSLSLAISAPILDETRQVLSGKKFRYPPEVASSIIAEIESISEYVIPTRHIDVLRNDPDDNVILECAYEFKADYMVSVDSHLLELGNYEGVRIVAPREFIQILEE